MAEYASHGVGAAGLTTGIIGTSLGVLNSGLLNGGLGGLFNGGNNCGCSDNMMVNRYEAAQSARIAELETEVKLRDANFYTLSEMGKLRDYVDGRINGIEQEICQQRVYNATNTSAMTCMQGQIAQLYSLTKLVVPNGSICPGWGDVTVSITPAPTTGA
jgi:hypothetical protein